MRITINSKKKFMKLFTEIFPNSNIEEINGISIDSRKIKENDIYIPLKGEKFDGNDFINDVLKIKGTICITDKKNIENSRILKTSSNHELLIKLATLWRGESLSKIIAITGSNGKTTTKELLFHILKNKYTCSKSLGNYNSTIGLPLSFLNCKINEDFTILELGANKPGEIKKLCEIVKPNYSLITNISNAHIENYNSLDEIRENKAEVFYSLSKNETAFINYNDFEIKKINFDSNKITFGINCTNTDYSALIKSKNLFQINDFSLKIKNEISHLKNTILAVYAISKTLGIDNNDFQKYLDSFSMPLGRGNSISKGGFTIIDDAYNANPASMYFSLDRFSNMKSKNKKILVIGDMLELGKDKIKEHRELGKYINKINIDIVFTFGNYSKETFESLDYNYTFKKHFDNIKKMKFEFNRMVDKGDVILIKGSRSLKLERLYQ